MSYGVVDARCCQSNGIQRHCQRLGRSQLQKPQASNKILPRSSRIDTRGWGPRLVERESSCTGLVSRPRSKNVGSSVMPK